MLTMFLHNLSIDLILRISFEESFMPTIIRAQKTYPLSFTPRMNCFLIILVSWVIEQIIIPSQLTLVRQTIVLTTSDNS